MDAYGSAGEVPGLLGMAETAEMSLGRVRALDLLAEPTVGDETR